MRLFSQSSASHPLPHLILMNVLWLWVKAGSTGLTSKNRHRHPRHPPAKGPGPLGSGLKKRGLRGLGRTWTNTFPAKDCESRVWNWWLQCAPTMSVLKIIDPTAGRLHKRHLLGVQKQSPDLFEQMFKTKRFWKPHAV